MWTSLLSRCYDRTGGFGVRRMLMKVTETLALVFSLVLASSLMVWIVRSQRPEVLVASIQSTQVQPVPVPEAQSVDELRVAELRTAAESAPEDVQVRVDLGNLFFEARRFGEAIPWFESPLALNSEAVEVSTDLGVAYFYMDDADRALSQFARSLEVFPAHAKTILNLGIVRAFGKQDLAGAIEAWEEVQRIAPGSQEALVAADAIERIRSAHP